MPFCKEKPRARKGRAQSSRVTSAGTCAAGQAGGGGSGKNFYLHCFVPLCKEKPRARKGHAQSIVCTHVRNVHAAPGCLEGRVHVRRREGNAVEGARAGVTLEKRNRPQVAPATL